MTKTAVKKPDTSKKTSRLVEKKKTQVKRHLKRTLQEYKNMLTEATVASKDAEVLLPSERGYIVPDKNEKIYKLKQKDMMQNIDLKTAKNSFQLSLTDFGPYNLNFSRNGRYDMNAINFITSSSWAFLQIYAFEWP